MGWSRVGWSRVGWSRVGWAGKRSCWPPLTPPFPLDPSLPCTRSPPPPLPEPKEERQLTAERVGVENTLKEQSTDKSRVHSQAKNKLRIGS